MVARPWNPSVTGSCFKKQASKGIKAVYCLLKAGSGSAFVYAIHIDAHEYVHGVYSVPAYVFRHVYNIYRCTHMSDLATSLMCFTYLTPFGLNRADINI